MYKLIIFDWDDVFTLGSKEGYFECYHKTLEEIGVSLSPKEERSRILSKWGQTYEEELKELLKERPELLSEAIRVYKGHFYGETFLNKLVYPEGTNEFLEKLSSKYKLAIATGSSKEMLSKYIFPKFNVPKVFDVIVTSHDSDVSGRSKPNPYMLNKIMNELNVSKTETLMVGDAENDVKMAQNASVTPVVVLTGHLTRAAAQKLGVKKIIQTLSDLESVI